MKCTTSERMCDNFDVLLCLKIVQTVQNLPSKYFLPDSIEVSSATALEKIHRRHQFGCKLFAISSRAALKYFTVCCD